MYKIRDWDKHFENAGSRKIESTKWVPMPNKRGFGYTKLIKQPKGEAMFGCWCALVELASTCEVRGELRSGAHWFNVEDFADLIGFSHKTITDTLSFCSKSLDWIEDMTATTSLPLDYQPTTTLLEGSTPLSVLCNSIQCSSIPSNSIQSDSETTLFNQIKELWYRVYEEIKGVKPAWISKGLGNYPKMIQGLAELGRPIEEYERAMRNGFSDAWHSQQMELKYLVEKFNVLLTYTPPQQKGRTLNEYERKAADKYV